MSEKIILKIPDTMVFPSIYDLWDAQAESGPDANRIYPFYKNLSDGKFVTTRCKTCGKLLYPPRILCPNCLSEDLEWVDIPKEGKIYAFTRMEAGAPLLLKDKLPLNIIIVRFGDYPANGIQMSGLLFDAPNFEQIKVGDKVEWDIMVINGPMEKKRYWYCFRYK